MKVVDGVGRGLVGLADLVGVRGVGALKDLLDVSLLPLEEGIRFLPRLVGHAVHPRVPVRGDGGWVIVVVVGVLNPTVLPKGKVLGILIVLVAPWVSPH